MMINETERPTLRWAIDVTAELRPQIVREVNKTPDNEIEAISDRLAMAIVMSGLFPTANNNKLLATVSLAAAIKLIALTERTRKELEE